MSTRSGAPWRDPRLLPGAAVVLLSGAAALAAEPGPSLHFERIGSSGGPPPAVITALLQDRSGFLWIGSRNGLVVFDGYTYTTYQHDPADPGSLTDNTIRTLYEDGDGSLWIGTNTGGLNRFDPASGSFVHYRHDSAEPRTLSHDSVYAVLRDRNGRLWVGTQRGLNRLDAGGSGFVRMHAGGPEGLSNDYVMALFEDRTGRLWVGTLGGGLHRWDEAAQRFETFRHDPGDPFSLTSDRVSALLEDDAGRLWVGTLDGLQHMDPERGTFVRISGLPDTLITTLARGTDGRIWIGTHRAGLAAIDTAHGRIDSWRHDPGRHDSLSEDKIIALLADRDGSLWIGTWGGGLARLSHAAQRFAGPEALAHAGAGPLGRNVTSLLCDRRGRFWVGTREGFLLRVDPVAQRYETVFEGGSRGVSQTMLDAIEDRKGRIWIATSSALLRVDPVSGQAREWTHDAHDPQSLGPGYVAVVYEDRSGGLWVGTGEGGLQRLDADGRVVERFVHDAKDAASLSDDYVTTLLEDRQGTLWVGTRSGGLNALDPASGRVQRFEPGATDPASIGHHHVSALFEDSSGRLWVGTAGGGLNRIERADGAIRFVRLTEQHGLVDDDVTGMLEDDDGSLWISTRRGLSRFDPSSGAFTNLQVSDGLPSAEFEPHAAARGGAWLGFGSVRGLVLLPAGTVFEAPRPSPVVVRSVRSASDPTPGPAAPRTPQRVELPYGSWLSVELAVLDFIPELEHRYAYRLGDEWVDIGSRREITFSALAPGTHALQVRGRNSQGVWNEASLPLEVKVVPPFWMTPAFRIALVVLIAALAFAAHWGRMRVLEKRNRELLDLHRQREKAQQDLADAYQRLRRLTIRLEASKEDERQRIARELHDEMGPSLTAVIISLQLLRGQRDRSGLAQKVAETVQLVDHMIQRIRDISLDLRPPFIDELGLVPALSGYLEGVSERAGISIHVDADPEVGTLPAHVPIAAFRVVQEAVTNAVRHSGATQVDVAVQRNGSRLDLRVQDNGRGFDVRETMERAVKGKALGLLGMKERVSMLYGDIDIASTPGQGTRIQVQLPLVEAT